ncbi:MAG: amidohydrolase [Spirochaetia bacterium]|nr:amidohydrolase [Spirochaetia bacterium]
MKDFKFDQNFEDELINIRRHLHQYPETAFEEYKTAAFIERKLKSYGLKVYNKIAKTGVIGELKNGDGPSIAFRADMDGLDIEELNTFSYKSRNQGKMHACGHDGHMTMLLGTAKYLSSNKNFKGTIYFIFQPAEENEGGAELMIKDKFFKKNKINSIFAMHNWPSLKTGKIGIKHGPIMAGYDRFEIILKGKGTHAAMPFKGNDLFLNSSEIIILLQNGMSRLNHLKPAVLSVTGIKAPESWNILPETITIKGTVRCFEDSQRDKIKSMMLKIIKSISQKDNIQYEFEYIIKYPVTVNSINETDIAINCFKEIFLSKNILTNIEPSMGSEDFSFLLQKIPGCYFFIGSGPARYGLHNPKYDFNDKILLTGVKTFINLAENSLKF